MTRMTSSPVTWWWWRRRWRRSRKHSCKKWEAWLMETPALTWMTTVVCRIYKPWTCWELTARTTLRSCMPSRSRTRLRARLSRSTSSSPNCQARTRPSSSIKVTNNPSMSHQWLREQVEQVTKEEATSPCSRRWTTTRPGAGTQWEAWLLNCSTHPKARIIGLQISPWTRAWTSLWTNPPDLPQSPSQRPRTERWLTTPHRTAPNGESLSKI